MGVDPNLVAPSEECSICLNLDMERPCRTPCMHWFCRRAFGCKLQAWLCSCVNWEVTVCLVAHLVAMGLPGSLCHSNLKDDVKHSIVDKDDPIKI